MPLIHARKAATNANWNKMGRLGKAKKKWKLCLSKAVHRCTLLELRSQLDNSTTHTHIHTRTHISYAATIKYYH